MSLHCPSCHLGLALSFMSSVSPLFLANFYSLFESQTLRGLFLIPPTKTKVSLFLIQLSDPIYILIIIYLHQIALLDLLCIH
jgi:hypothetical protein